MLIRPPVVREMRRNLFAEMTATPEDFTPRAESQASDLQSGTDTRLAQLKQLGDLRASGVLTQEEFEREKARLLG